MLELNGVYQCTKPKYEGNVKVLRLIDTNKMKYAVSPTNGGNEFVCEEVYLK